MWLEPAEVKDEDARVMAGIELTSFSNYFQYSMPFCFILVKVQIFSWITNGYERYLMCSLSFLSQSFKGGMAQVRSY